MFFPPFVGNHDVHVSRIIIARAQHTTENGLNLQAGEEIVGDHRAISNKGHAVHSRHRLANWVKTKKAGLIRTLLTQMQKRWMGYTFGVEPSIAFLYWGALEGRHADIGSRPLHYTQFVR